MVPEDGDPPRPRTNTGGAEAFAATIAPSLPGQVPIAAGTPSPPSKVVSAMESDATMAAPLEGKLPPLPTIPHASYKTDKEIARGGMGRIVSAEDQRLGRPVALKELIDPSPDSMGRFQ